MDFLKQPGFLRHLNLAEKFVSIVKGIFPDDWLACYPKMDCDDRASPYGSSDPASRAGQVARCRLLERDRG
jgi:hypothetical protein